MITLQLKSFGLVIYFFMFLEDTFFKVFFFVGRIGLIQKYSTNSTIVKYYCNLKKLLSFVIYFTM